MNNIAKPLLGRNKTIHKETGIILCMCIVISGLICIGHIIGSRLVLLVGLLLFLGHVLYTSDRNVAIEVFLFFLPWSPLLKLRKGEFSFFSIALLLSCLYCFVKNRFSLKLQLTLLTMSLFVITLTGKMIHGNSPDYAYIFFFCMLALFPCVIRDVLNNTSFDELTLFFMAGIITAALSAQHFAGYPNIRSFIRVDSYLTITRLSGYYADPNFYSAHINACLAGLQVMLMKKKDRVSQALIIMSMILLLYCGMLSASKSFIVVTVVLFLFWFPMLLKNEHRNSVRIRLLAGLLGAGLVIVSSTFFKELFQVLDARFAQASNISDLTTGRTDVWIKYLTEFSRNPLLTIFGEGYSNVVYGGKASHNTLLQLIYQFGVTGTSVFIIWFYGFLKEGVSQNRNTEYLNGAGILLLTGVVLPWMALDILFFDEVFLLPVYAVLGILYYSEE